MTFETIKNTADTYLMPTYAKTDVAVISGKGATLCDEKGRTIIDFTSGIGVVSLGYADEQWAKAVGEQALKLQHSSNLYYNVPAAQLAQELCEKSGYGKVFFCNSGAEANECALKLARKYSFDKYGKDRFAIISLKNSFHGRTLATLTATGQEEFHNYFFPFAEGFKYVQANDIGALESMLDGTVCAVIIELIQGEGGVLPLDENYVKAVESLCREKDILLIADEVQTGIGRTGKFFAAEAFGIKPDVLTSAKGLGNGLPIGACLCKEEFGNVLSAGMHGTTFGGNPVVCAGALEVLDRMDDDFLNEVTKKGAYIKSKLQEISEIEEVRGMGLMLGLKLKTKDAKQTAKKCAEKGLLVLTAKTLLRLLPPLTISYDEIDEGIRLLKSVLEEECV